MPVLLLLTSSCMTLDKRCLKQHVWALDALKQQTQRVELLSSDTEIVSKLSERATALCIAWMLLLS
jgi:hypothetical protein